MEITWAISVQSTSDFYKIIVVLTSHLRLSFRCSFFHIGLLDQNWVYTSRVRVLHVPPKLNVQFSCTRVTCPAKTVCIILMYACHMSRQNCVYISHVRVSHVPPKLCVHFSCARVTCPAKTVCTFLMCACHISRKNCLYNSHVRVSHVPPKLSVQFSCKRAVCLAYISFT
jgi:hypothetical protein